MKNWRNILINSLLVIGSLALSLVAAEYAARWWFRPSDQEYSVNATGNQYKFYQFDPVLGWSNAPKMHGTFKREEYQFDFSINELGMRQAPVTQEPDGRHFRIAFLGDSFLWGIGVSNEERLTDILGTKPGIEALNFGVSGYGPIQYYLMLDHVLRFRPDMVVIMFTPSNDYLDNTCSIRYNHYKPYATLDPFGKLEIEGYPVPDQSYFGAHWEWSSQHSVLLQKITELFTHPSDKEEGLCFAEYAMYEPAREDDQEIKRAIAINKALFAGIKAKLEKAHVPLLVVINPTKCEYHRNCSQGATPGLYPQAVNIMQNTMQRLHIPFISPIHEMDADDFWHHDGHWNPGGQAKMAGFIYQYLLQNHYVPEAPRTRSSQPQPP